MRTESYGSAKITYLDKDAIWEAASQMAQELGRRHREIRRILVFGSFVRDQAAPGSDLDLIVVLDESDLPFLDRPAHYRAGRFLIPLDLLVYTNDEIEGMLAEGNSFLRHALAEGVTIYEREAG